MKNRKQHIYAEAAKLFREKGYSATSIRELAEKVGLEPSSLYSHIRSKEEILCKICFDNAHKFMQGLEEIEKSGGNPADQLRSAIRLHIRIALEDKTSSTVFNDEWRHLSEPKLSEFLNMRRNYEKRLIHIIESGMKSGKFKPMDPQIVLHTLLSSVQWIHYKQRSGKQNGEDTLQEEITELLLGGLEKQPAF